MSLFVAIPLVLIFSAVTLAMPAILAASAPLNRATRRKSRAEEPDICAEDGSAVQSPGEEQKFEDV